MTNDIEGKVRILLKEYKEKIKLMYHHINPRPFTKEDDDLVLSSILSLTTSKLKFKLIEHNSEEQMKWAGGFDDTRKYLKVGEIYEGKREIHSWHTKILIEGKSFNSVCFEEVSLTTKPLDEKEVEKFLKKYCGTCAKEFGWCIHLLSKKFIAHFSKPVIKLPEKKYPIESDMGPSQEEIDTCNTYNQAIDDMRKLNGEGI